MNEAIQGYVFYEIAALLVPDAGGGDAPDVILFGLGRYGLGIASSLRAAGLKVLGVDFGPQAVRFAEARRYTALYGDVTDPEFLAHLPLAKAKWLVSAAPEHDTGLTHDDPRRALLSGARDLNFSGKIAVVTHRKDNTAQLLAADADIVLMPYRDAAESAARMILQGQRTEVEVALDPSGQKALCA